MKLIDILKEVHAGSRESRTNVVHGLDDFVELYQSNCSDHTFTNTTIYRGLRYDINFGLIEPAEHSRKSAYTENYYTLIIDHSANWSGYPNRSESVVATTSETYSKNFGDSFVVIPFDGAKIAVASEEDLWESFRDTLPDYINRLDQFNAAIKVLGNRVMGGNTINDDNIQKFRESLDQVGRKIKQSGLDSLQSNFELDYTDKTAFQLLINFKSSNFDSLYKYVSQWIVPEKNGFKVVNYSSSFSAADNNEVWTESPCLLIRNDEELLSIFRDQIQ